MTPIAVIYYSATGNVHALARAVADLEDQPDGLPSATAAPKTNSSNGKE